MALGLLTLGLGFMTGQALPLIAGATLYALGWVYMPDFSFFRNWIDRRRKQAKEAADMAKIQEFARRRQALLDSLAPRHRERYRNLAVVCRDIEAASADNPLAASTEPARDPRLRKLDELMWTFLRLLGIEQSLERFLENERGEDIPGLLKDAEAETARLNSEMEALKAKGKAAALENKQRYLDSRQERLEVLRKREQRIEQAQENLNLVVSEQDRLEQQIKLLRADAVASKNAETLTARIDATVEHLDQTNKWLSELDEFKDIVGDIPATEVRVGYDPMPVIPPVIEQPQGQKRQKVVYPQGPR